MFTGGEGDVGLASDVFVGRRIFGADGVFDEEGFELFELAAESDGVCGVEAGVDVGADLDVGSDGFAERAELLDGHADRLHGVKFGGGGLASSVLAD